MRFLRAFLVFALVTGALAAIPTVAAAADTVVTGKVTDSTGHPVAHVRVLVGAYTPWSGSGDDVYTAADGTYRASGVLWSDQGQVCFDTGSATGGTGPYGYAQQCYRNVPSIPQWGPAGTTVVIQPGVVTPNIDATLQSAGAVTGFVRDNQGRPLANVWVTASDGPSHFYRDAETGADGSYTVRGLPANRYRVCFSPATLGNLTSPPSPTGYSWQCAGQSVGVSGDPTVDVAAAAASRQDMTLLPGAAIRGRVLDDRGQPVAGRRVHFEPFQNGTVNLPTDADGNYEITGLQPGTYTVCIDGRKQGEGAGPGLQAGCWDAAPPKKPTKITLGVSQIVTGIDVRLHDQPVISGRLTDAAGAPVSGVAVEVDYQDVAVTDAKGRYAYGVDPGRHVVCFRAANAVGASATGYLDQCWRDVTSGSPSDATPVVAPKQGNVTGIGATLVAASALTVRVVDIKGKAVRNAYVFVRDPATGGSIMSVRTDDSGRASATSLRSGTFTISMPDDSWWDAKPRTPFGYADLSVPVVLSPGVATTTVVKARAQGTVAGTVTDADGSPVDDAIVTLTGPAYAPSWSTDSTGAFATEGMPPGRWKVCASAWVGPAGGQRYATTCFGGPTPDDSTPVVVKDGLVTSAVDIRFPAG